MHPCEEKETKTAVSRCSFSQSRFRSTDRDLDQSKIVTSSKAGSECMLILRKEVIQPQVPLRLPCYDFTPVTDLTVAGCLLAVSAPSSGKTNSHGVTGGVYKARERIHRAMLMRDY